MTYLRPLAVAAAVGVALLPSLVSPAAGSAAGRADPVESRVQRAEVISNCVKPHYKPKRIILTCGDANQLVDHLRYVTWMHRRAAGAGRFVYNDCQPNCASGHAHHFHVTITLTRVRSHDGRRLFTRLTTTDHDGRQQTYPLLTKGV